MTCQISTANTLHAFVAAFDSVFRVPRDFHCISYVVRVCHGVTRKSALWKMTYNIQYILNLLKFS
jgi:hypothetical protein